MSERIVEVDLHFRIKLDAGTAAMARSMAAGRAVAAIDHIDGVSAGRSIGTSGGEEVDDA